jgi:hypothetical protein
MKKTLCLFPIFFIVNLLMAQSKPLQETYYEKARANYSNQAYKNALKDLRTSLFYDSAKYYSLAGDCLRKLEIYHPAIQLYDSAIRLDRTYYPAWYNRGIAYFMLNDFQKAKSDFVMALQLKPGDTMFQRSLALAEKNLAKGAQPVAITDADKWKEIRLAAETQFRNPDITELEWAVNYEQKNKPDPTGWLAMELAEKKAYAILSTMDKPMKNLSGEEKLKFFIAEMNKQFNQDFVAMFYMLLKTTHFNKISDTTRIIMARLPETMRNAIRKMSDFHVQLFNRANGDPSKYPAYPADLPWPGTGWTAAHTAKLSNKLNLNNNSAGTQNIAGNSVKPSGTAPAKKGRLTLEMREKMAYKTGRVYIVKGYRNNYKHATDSKVYFFATHADEEYMYGITVYYVAQNSGGYAERSDEVRLSGKVMVYEKQFVDHEQFWNEAYNYSSCNKSVSICGRCNGSGNGSSRNTRRSVTEYGKSPGNYGKKLTFEKVFYDFYPCETCKGKGGFNF